MGGARSARLQLRACCLAGSSALHFQLCALEKTGAKSQRPSGNRETGRASEVAVVNPSVTGTDAK